MGLALRNVPQPRLHRREQFLGAVAAFFHHRRDPIVEKSLLGLGRVFAAHDDDGDGAQGRVAAEVLEEFETIHLRHDEIEDDGGGACLGEGGERLDAVAGGEGVPSGGLEKAGGSTYRTSINSGAPTLGAAGSGGIGALVGGALEMSNVDLSQEFINMILASTGYSAASRVITTTDELINQLLALGR